MLLRLKSQYFSGIRTKTFLSKFAQIPKIYCISIHSKAQFIYLLADLFKAQHPHFLLLIDVKFKYKKSRVL